MKTKPLYKGLLISNSNKSIISQYRIIPESKSINK